MVLNQSENGRYNLISVSFVSFLSVWLARSKSSNNNERANPATITRGDNGTVTRAKRFPSGGV